MTTEIRTWLGTLGLESHAGLFEREQIDMRALPHLSDADLKALGLPTGARVRIVAAIQSLKDGNAASIESSPSVSPPPPDEAISFTSGERRQLTVLFCDMAGFTELALLRGMGAYRDG